MRGNGPSLRPPPIPSPASGGGNGWGPSGVRVWAALVLLAAPLSAAGPALGQDVDQRATVLHLSQTAERSVMRDLLRIELRAEEAGADARSVQAAINRRMAAALDRAHQVQGVRLETGTYSVGEERPQNGPARWRGRQSVILTGKDAEFDAEARRSAAIGGALDRLAGL